MSYIGSFYLINGNRSAELPDGGCSGEVYTALWDYCEENFDIDCRMNAPQNDGIADCVLIDEKMAAELLEQFKNCSLNGMAAAIAQDWELPQAAAERCLTAFIDNLALVQDGAVLLYEMN